MWRTAPRLAIWQRRNGADKGEKGKRGKRRRQITTGVRTYRFLGSAWFRTENGFLLDSDLISVFYSVETTKEPAGNLDRFDFFECIVQARDWCPSTGQNKLGGI